MSFNMLQSCSSIRSDVAPGSRSCQGWKGWMGGDAERPGCFVFLPFLSTSRKQAVVKWLRVPPTVKLIELVIRRVETSIRPEEASGASVLTFARDKGTAGAGGSGWICGQFPPKRCLRTRPSFTWLVWHCGWSRETCRWLLLEALFGRAIGFVHRSAMSRW